MPLVIGGGGAEDAAGAGRDDLGHQMNPVLDGEDPTADEDFRAGELGDLGGLGGSDGV